MPATPQVPGTARALQLGTPNHTKEKQPLCRKGGYSLRPSFERGYKMINPAGRHAPNQVRTIRVYTIYITCTRHTDPEMAGMPPARRERLSQDSRIGLTHTCGDTESPPQELVSKLCLGTPCARSCASICGTQSGNFPRQRLQSTTFRTQLHFPRTAWGRVQNTRCNRCVEKLLHLHHPHLSPYPRFLHVWLRSWRAGSSWAFFDGVGLAADRVAPHSGNEVVAVGVKPFRVDLHMFQDVANGVFGKRRALAGTVRG